MAIHEAALHEPSPEHLLHRVARPRSYSRHGLNPIKAKVKVARTRGS